MKLISGKYLTSVAELQHNFRTVQKKSLTTFTWLTDPIACLLNTIRLKCLYVQLYSHELAHDYHFQTKMYFQ